jgi:DNA modification methylase
MASGWITRLLRWAPSRPFHRPDGEVSSTSSGLRARIARLLRNQSLPVGEVLVGDCVEILAQLPEQSIDVIFADPPYNLQLNQELYRPNLTRVDGVSEAWDQFESFQEYDDFTRDWLNACHRVLKNTGTIWVIGSYHNIYRVGTIMQDLGFWFLNDIAWIKSNPTPNFRGVRFTNAHETLLWAQKKKGGKYTFNHHAMKSLNDDLQMRSDWIVPICSGKERLRENGVKAHPTQKPEALLYRVVLASSNPHDIILDPFFGTGTTGAVAKKLQRQWIGIEREPSYARLARQRIDSIEPGLFSEDIYVFPTKRDRPRVAFGNLLESGLLRPDQHLYFGPKGQPVARVCADGEIECGGIVGSIHQVGRRLTNAPCNGWEHWYYDDELDGRRPIDHLREIYLQRLKTQQ